jgi:hypothetical protein
MNGQLDFQKDLHGRDNFLQGHGPLYIGRDPWHKSSTFTMSKFSLVNKTLSGADIREMFDTQYEAVNSLTNVTPNQDKPKDSVFSFSHSDKATTAGGSENVDASREGGLTVALLATHDELQEGRKDAAASQEGTGSVHEHSDDCASDNGSGGEDRFLDSISLVQSEAGGAAPGRAPSTATSQVTVLPSRHLTQRQVERDIDLHELQVARKDGV